MGVAERGADILRQSTWYIHQEDTESLEKAEFFSYHCLTIRRPQFCVG